MLPLVGTRLDQLIRIALHNAQAFDRFAFEGWLAGRPGVAGVARARPPDRLYRIVTDDELAGRAAHLLYGVVVAYVEPQGGAPGRCCVHVLGVLEGAGSVDTPLVIPASALEDVTDRARAGRLRAVVDE